MEEAQSARDSLDAFLAACGVTVRLEETPRNRFEEAEEPSPVSEGRQAAAPDGAAGERQVSRSRRPAGSLPPAVETGAPAPAGDDEAVHAAREVARSARDLEALHAALGTFDGCPLKATARRTCFGEGPVGAPLMVVGEAPGRDEDEAGRPFVGRSGKLLDRMLAAIGFRREEVFVSNVIPWRPVGNRTPSPIETATCEVFVRREILLVRPKILVLLGGAAAKTLLRSDISVMRQHGRLMRLVPDEVVPDVEIEAVPTFHPAYLLRTPADKAKAWRDLLSIRARLEEAHGLSPLR